MTRIELCCHGAAAKVHVEGELTAGAVGIPVTVEYDSAWDGLDKTIVFRTTRKSRGAVGEDITVPWELLEPELRLEIGVIGRDAAGKLVIPTVWADCGRIKPAPEAADVQAMEPEPSPTMLEQIRRIAQQALDAAANYQPGDGEAVPVPGPAGADGKSAYELAVEQGYQGTQTQWLAGLKGEKGDTGAAGPKGDTGAKGDTGPRGADGKTPVKGEDYYTEAEQQALKSEIAEAIGNPGIERVYDFDALGGIPGSDSDGKSNSDLLQQILADISADAGEHSSGAMVLFRSPFYYFGKQVSMYRLRGVTFAGLSPRTVLRSKCGADVYAFKLDGLYCVTFRNLAFWGSGSNNGLTAVDSEPDTQNSRIANVFFEDCEFENFRQAVSFEAPTGYIRFHRTAFFIPSNGSGCRLGMNISTESYAYKNGVFPNYIYFTECTFEGHSDGAEKHALEIGLAQCITIDKCDICNFTHATVPAITITPQPSKPVSHFLFRNNFFFNNKNSVMVDLSLGNLNGLSFIGNHNYVRSSDNTLIKVVNGVSYHKVTGMTMAGNTLVGQSSYNYKILEASYVDRLLIQDEMDVFDSDRYVLTNCTNVTRMGDFESAGNKASAITEDNKDSTDAYPSVKAVTDLIGYLASQIPSGNFEDAGNKIAEVTEQNRNSTTFYPSMKVLSDAVGYVTSLIPSGNFENSDNKASAITESNKSRTDFYASVKAVTDYVASQIANGNFESAGNKLAAITEDTLSSTTAYPSVKAMVDFVFYIAQGFPGMQTVTQAQYDAIAVKDADTYYFIVEG